MKSITALKNLAQIFFDFALPPKCLNCSADVFKQGTICHNCYSGFKIIGQHKCHKCGLPFEYDLGKKAVCGACAYEKPKYDTARAFCKYENIGADLAVKLKFSDKTHLAPYMAKLIAMAGSGLIKKSDIIAPIPLHYSRKLRRKYNQAALLAKHIAKECNLEYQPFLLKRVRNTKRQTTLPKFARKKNMQDAFMATKDLADRRILIIDDVMTTGATISSAAVALKKRGAKKVYGLVFARVE